jgi:hypothetical protein
MSMCVTLATAYLLDRAIKWHAGIRQTDREDASQLSITDDLVPLIDNMLSHGMFLVFLVAHKQVSALNSCLGPARQGYQQHTHKL